MSINTEINRLLNFARQNTLINEDDFYYAANRLIDVLKVDAFEPELIDEALPTAMPILDNMLDYAAEKGIIENTTEERDLFDTRIMDCVMPRPSEVVRRFRNDYARSPKAATDEFYKLSIASNYIRKDRIDKNIIWKTATETATSISQSTSPSRRRTRVISPRPRAHRPRAIRNACSAVRTKAMPVTPAIRPARRTA